MTLIGKYNLNTRHCCLLLFLLLATLTGCYVQPSSAIQPEDGFLIDQSTVIFFVSTPFNTSADAEIYLDIVDEITGTNFNLVRHKMQFISDNLYSVELSFPVSSMVKYRYALGSSPTTSEYDPRGNLVRYRVVNTQQGFPVVARDVVASWMNTPLNVSLGRTEGRLTDATTGAGIPDLIVNLNGLQSTTSPDGTFLIDNALPGKYLLTIYHMNGSYQPFQQEAIIASAASTPIEVSLTPRPTTQVTFIVTPPSDHNKSAPIRIIGSTMSLGNTFTEHPGGTSIRAANAPTLNPQPDGTCKITLSLPAGTDLRYKYSLGDGFWNAERHADGQFITRQLIVPDEDITITESIARWKTGDRPPIRIEARSLSDKNSLQQVYIQLNSFSWTEPIPMWLDSNDSSWLYEIFSPLYLFPSVGYRLCYDAQCNSIIAINDSGDTEGTRIPTDGSQSLIQITLPSDFESTSKAAPSNTASQVSGSNALETPESQAPSAKGAPQHLPPAHQGRPTGLLEIVFLPRMELTSISVNRSSWHLETFS